MVVVKTITVAFQTKVNRSIFIAVRSGTFHTLNMACHFARSLHVSFFEHATANVKSCQNEHNLAEPLCLASYHVLVFCLRTHAALVYLQVCLRVYPYKLGIRNFTSEFSKFHLLTNWYFQLGCISPIQKPRVDFANIE